MGVGLILLVALIYLELGARYGRNGQKVAELAFESTSSLENSLNGDENIFSRFFYTTYHCSPSEKNGVTQYRNELSKSFPDKTTKVGAYFVLWGEAAFLATSKYYLRLSEESLCEDIRSYALERFEQITERHKKSQSLPIPIDLSEGQLCNDDKFEYYTRVSISSGHLTSK